MSKNPKLSDINKLLCLQKPCNSISILIFFNKNIHDSNILFPKCIVKLTKKASKKKSN